MYYIILNKLDNTLSQCKFKEPVGSLQDDIEESSDTIFCYTHNIIISQHFHMFYCKRPYAVNYIKLLILLGIFN